MTNKQQLEQSVTPSLNVRNTFYSKPYAMRGRLNKMSQKYEIRRPHFEGKKESSCSMILPAKFVEHIGIEKGDYVRIYEENNRIIVERMANQVGTEK